MCALGRNLEQPFILVDKHYPVLGACLWIKAIRLLSDAVVVCSIPPKSAFFQKEGGRILERQISCHFLGAREMYPAQY